MDSIVSGRMRLAVVTTVSAPTGGAAGVLSTAGHRRARPAVSLQRVARDTAKCQEWHFTGKSRSSTLRVADHPLRARNYTSQIAVWANQL